MVSRDDADWQYSNTPLTHNQSNPNPTLMQRLAKTLSIYNRYPNTNPTLTPS